MSEPTAEQEASELAEINKQGLGKRLGFYTKRSGPGWLQGAITLGGGSLGGALFLGVICGFNLMWLQPLAMICGIIMLAAISYVTLSTGERPLGLINRNLSPALGWAWIIATVMANIIWCMPQFNLGYAAVQQNILPAILPDSVNIADNKTSKWIIGLCFLAFALFVNYLYDSGSKGAKLFDIILKVMVGIVVLSFFIVVASLTFNKMIPWGKIFTGFIPNFSYIFNPAPAYQELIAGSSDAGYWTTKIADLQRDRVFAAFAAAVGINMTFLLPYSMLKKRWGKHHRPLAIFDLSLGLFIPFFLATTCVLIAAASQFHGTTTGILDDNGVPFEKKAGAYTKFLSGVTAPNGNDQKLAAMLVSRDNLQLAKTLEPIAGETVAQLLFGIGVLGMAVSTIIILMLINGLAFQELINKPDSRVAHKIGCIVAGIAGLIGLFVWGNGNAKAAMTIPTSVIGGSMIPIAYFTFLLMMNSKTILGEHMPTGIKRVIWNVLMIFATVVASAGSIWALYGKATSKAENFGFKLQSIVGTGGLILLFILLILGIVGFINNKNKSRT